MQFGIFAGQNSGSFAMGFLGLTVLALLFLHTGASWVDPDTPDFYRTTQAKTASDKRHYDLVFSDEFETDGRDFKDGSDPRWTAINKNDYTNDALHFYSDDNVATTNGVLNITTEFKVNVYKAFNEETKKFYADKKHVQSGMVQGWNKFCFTGGIVEFSARLPGRPDIGGLWPALWMLGNLARATYIGSTDYMWPYSYNKCDPRKRLSQEISACSRVNHYGMAPFTGRGAPEIDVIEAMQGEKEKLPSTNVTRPYQSCSFQVAPGIERNRPTLGLPPKKGRWYEGMEYNDNNATKSELNPFFYGVTLVHKSRKYTYQSDALSANIGLNHSYYTSQQKYRVEWEPPEEDGSGGYIRWYTNDVLLYGVKGANLNITGAEIPREAMYLIMNTAVASSWGFTVPCPDDCSCECYECGNPDCECAIPEGYCDNFPAFFEIDYVRVYQARNESKHTLGCSPEARPTKDFITGHLKRYMEEGDRQPLLPIRNGGGYCSHDKDCGDEPNGVCSSRGYCICNQTFTGPMCVAHAGYYDFESKNSTVMVIGWADLYFPTSMVVLFALLAIGFVGSMIATLRTRTKRRSGRRIGRQHQSHFQKTPVSYQNSSEYALPQKQNVVTYCVIDGRLVDQ